MQRTLFPKCAQLKCAKLQKTPAQNTEQLFYWKYWSTCKTLQQCSEQLFYCYCTKIISAECGCGPSSSSPSYPSPSYPSSWLACPSYPLSSPSSWLFSKSLVDFYFFKIISCIYLCQGWGNTITDLFLHHRNQLSQLSGQISVLHGISDKLQRVEAILIGIGTWQEDFGAASLSPTAFDWRTAVRITFWWQFREYQVQCTLESTFQSEEEEIYRA